MGVRLLRLLLCAQSLVFALRIVVSGCMSYIILFVLAAIAFSTWPSNVCVFKLWTKLLAAIQLPGLWVRLVAVWGRPKLQWTAANLASNSENMTFLRCCKRLPHFRCLVDVTRLAAKKQSFRDCFGAIVTPIPGDY